MPPTKEKPLTNLRRLRLEQGKTQIQLAVFSGCSEGTVKKIETSTDHGELLAVEPWTWVKLARELKVRVRDIYSRIHIHPGLES